MAHAADPDFSTVLGVGPCSESLFANFTCKELRALQLGVGNDELRHLIDSYLERYPMRAADVEAGQHVALLHHLVTIPGLRLELPPWTYLLERRNQRNAAHDRRQQGPRRVC